METNLKIFQSTRIMSRGRLFRIIEETFTFVFWNVIVVVVIIVGWAVVEKGPRQLQMSQMVYINSRESFAWVLRLFMASPPGLVSKTLRVWMRLCVCACELQILCRWRKQWVSRRQREQSEQWERKESELRVASLAVKKIAWNVIYNQY